MIKIPYGDDSLRRHHEFVRPLELDTTKNKTQKQIKKTAPKIERAKEEENKPEEKPKFIKSDNWVPFEKRTKAKFNDETYKHYRIPETKKESGTLNYGVISFIICTAGAAIWYFKDIALEWWNNVQPFFDAII